MQALLSHKETKLWMDGKTEADRMRDKLKARQAETKAVAGALRRVQAAVKERDGCHHDGTREGCRGCLLYEDETDGKTWLMCTTFRKL